MDRIALCSAMAILLTPSKESNLLSERLYGSGGGALVWRLCLPMLCYAMHPFISLHLTYFHLTVPLNSSYNMASP
jgi:hypothetical protein